MDIAKLNNEQLIKYIKLKISEFDEVKERMSVGIRYYNGEHDIEKKQRLGIGENGKLMPILNLPNTKITDNQYKKGVDQKINYVLSQPPNIDSKDDKIKRVLTDIFDMRMLRALSKVAKDTYNTGIGWLYIYTDGEKFLYKKMNSQEIIPLWEDSEKEKLQGIIRLYSYEVFEDEQVKTKNQVHFYTKEKISIYDYENDQLTKAKDSAYLEKGEAKYNYGKIPFVYFKLPDEKPLIYRVKNLQDALNTILSNFNDNMLEDKRNTILVLKNYDGTDLGEFREKLAQYGAIKVTDADGMHGGVETLEINVNSENYKVLISVLKKAIKDNLRMLDLSDEKIISQPNTLTVKAMYSDMELDANALELEFTASFEYMVQFIKQIKSISEDVKPQIKFKRSMMINSETVVDMIQKSTGIISRQTAIAKHPLVDDAQEELKRLEEEQKHEQKYMQDDFSLGEKDDQLLEK